MAKTIVIYESKYGSTKQYAEWISSALSCEAREKKAFHPSDFKNYDTVIFGGGLYAGGVSGISLLTKNFPLIQEKNIILFTCGLADPKDEKNQSHIKASLSKVLTPEMQNHFHLFSFRGAIDYSKLTFIHKSMMAMLHRVMQKKEPSSLTEEDQLMLQTYGKKVTFLDHSSIQPLVEYVRSL